MPFELKLDMARQCWDEARHVEISVKLTEHMGSEIGEFAEQTLLFEAACNSDAILRLAGVNRALEGLAIDVFNTMREFGGAVDDPVLYFCEDWMLADEVTHVKMGSDWLRRITADDPGASQGRPRLPAHRRQAVQLRRLPRRGGGEPDPPGPQVPDAWPGSTTTRSPTWSTPRPRPTPRRRPSGPRPSRPDHRPGPGAVRGRSRRSTDATTDRARCSSTSIGRSRGSSSWATAWPACGRSAPTGGSGCGAGPCGGSPSPWRSPSSSRWPWAWAWWPARSSRRPSSTCSTASWPCSAWR